MRFQGSYQSAIHYDQLNDLSGALVRYERVLNTPPTDQEQQELLENSKLRFSVYETNNFGEDIAQLQQQQDWKVSKISFVKTGKVVLLKSMILY